MQSEKFCDLINIVPCGYVKNVSQRNSSLLRSLVQTSFLEPPSVGAVVVLLLLLQPLAVRTQFL